MNISTSMGNILVIAALSASLAALACSMLAARGKDRFLKPAGLLYRGGVALKNTLYRRRILKPFRVGVPVISVGNLDAGGSGKTPFVAYLAGRMREAGCREVMVVGERRFALLYEYRDAPEPGPLELAQRLAGADIVLFEGFRSAPIPMIEVFRPALGRPMLWPECRSVVAIASDGAIDCPLPVLDLAQPAAIAAFVLAHLGIGAPVR